jgi:hypothetical protein
MRKIKHGNEQKTREEREEQHVLQRKDEMHMKSKNKKEKLHLVMSPIKRQK